MGDRKPGGLDARRPVLGNCRPRPVDLGDHLQIAEPQRVEETRMDVKTDMSTGCHFGRVLAWPKQRWAGQLLTARRRPEDL